MSNGWMELVERGRIDGYTDEPVEGAVPLPVDVPVTDPLAMTCQWLGFPVYPVHEMDGWGTTQ